jgi:xanthine dehydrogenase/oxidase
MRRLLSSGTAKPSSCSQARKARNPAIDIGQIEGGFMQGIGYLLTEDVVYQPDAPNQGALSSTNTWRYKIPAITTVPLDFRVHLFPRSMAAHVPEEPNTLFSSKEVGEPPVVLANAAFFAGKAAVRSARVQGGLSPVFEMPAPATVQTVSLACAVSDWRD